jgi:hypothetical protein
MMPKWKRDLKTYRRNDWVWQYCGYDFKTSCDAFWRGCISVDHLKPRKYGGSDDETNRFTCCHSCNTAKGQTDFDIGAVEDVKLHIRLYREEYRQPWFENYVKGGREDRWNSELTLPKRFEEERKKIKRTGDFPKAFPEVAMVAKQSLSDA